MDYSTYDAILSATIWRHLTIFLVVEVLFVIGLTLNIILYRKTTKALANAKRREAEQLDRRQSRLLVTTIAAALCIPLCAVMGYFRVAGMRRDLSRHNYVVSSAAYDRPSHRRSITDDGIAYITIDGVSTRMYLSSGGSVEEFPLGEHEGVACYAAESKVLLSFSEQEDAQ